MNMKAPIVGIDLGTTNSAVAVFEKGEVRVLPNALGESLTPSVVALDQRTGALTVGRTAKDIYLKHPDLGAALFKRGMGSDLRYTIAGAGYGAVELSTLVLKSLRRDAEEALAREVRSAVITVPAYFDDAQRFATMKAGELAGLDVERIVNEPTAAAIAHGAHELRSDATLLVIDLGGGTFDVCVMDRFEGALEVRSVAGESMLGGEDFTRRLAALGLRRADVPFEHAEASDPDAMLLLVKRSELLKRKLSEASGGTLEIPPMRGYLENATTVTFTREEAEIAFAPLVDRLRGPCRAALLGAELNRTDVEEIILVGGATRMPCVREFVLETFGREPLGGVDPDLAVVHGAAVQGALCRDHNAVGDMVVTDVASHSLGVEITKEFGGKRVSGFFLPIIHRNSVIPTSQTDVLGTLDANQAHLTLKVFEGESRHVKDNRHIGEMKVTGIPKGPPGRLVKVRFTYDLNGILEVETTIVSTGKKARLVIEQRPGTMSEEELDTALKRMLGLKLHPRDALPNTTALARAEALFAELTGGARRELGATIAALRLALEGQEPEQIARFREALVSLTEALRR